MADLTVSSDIDSFMAAADKPAMRVALGLSGVVGILEINGGFDDNYENGEWANDIDTTGLALGTIYKFADEVDGDFVFRQFMLKAGTDATNLPGTVRGPYYAPGTNEKVWVQIS